MATKKPAAIKEKFTKTQMLTEIADKTGVGKKDVGNVLDELSILMERHLKKKACGEFTIPGLLKVVTVKKPARKAQKGVPNPFKPGETMDVPAKPASVAVKARPLKRLKEFANG